ncbi:MAG: helix-turn-helix transcriptional regulator [Erysipelotrichaceae bacterium]|nr:helix-turn-helix transcriptional regulator [Erysipelotrichaceae bacterium]
MSSDILNKIPKLNYGDLIKDIKKETGLTAEKLSIITGIPKSTIDKITSNRLKKGPTAAQLFKITYASRYNTIKWVSDQLGVNVISGMKQDSQENLSADEWEIIKLLRQFNNPAVTKNCKNLLREIGGPVRESVDPQE